MAANQEFYDYNALKEKFDWITNAQKQLPNNFRTINVNLSKNEKELEKTVIQMNDNKNNNEKLINKLNQEVIKIQSTATTSEYLMAQKENWRN